ncbi:uncharacterized protein LOC106161002 [Lingula anatina]|uniref:Uncharacterized protein LOC106161002 n=1 Tax=Lingula anatina TaxID=7574 RepID=A0A1S3I4T6_LINAN|nr:uncharacterized protein LOC106161002 [Lingula anatina]|eukprot:XP_013393280.1 uncharacterized protein LOC106161002 [Lingula anatina]
MGTLWTALLLLGLISSSISEVLFDADDKNGTVSNQVHDLGSTPHVCRGNLAKCDEGMTLAVSLRPSRQPPKHKYTYFISNGGQTAASEGFYIRQNYGKEFEVGVAKQGTLWTVRFGLDARKWTTVTLVWNLERGLTVFVDGFLVQENRAGVSRLHIPYTIDPFPRLLVGKANDEVSSAEMFDGNVRTVRHWSYILTIEELQNIDDTNLFRLGCLASVAVETTDVTEFQHPVMACRQHCHASGRKVALLKDNKLCGCFDTPEDVRDLQATCDPSLGSWEVFTVSHVTDTMSEVTVQVKKETFSQKPYTLPGEEVLLRITSDADEDVWYIVDFKDGVTVETTKPDVSHSWKNPGTYSVNVTVLGRTVAGTATVDVEIQFVDEGERPEVVDIVAYEESTASRYIRHQLTSIGRAPMTCTMDFGDESPLFEVTFNEFIGSHDVYHNYSLPGLYRTSATCKNKFGERSTSEIIRARNWYFDHTLMSTGDKVVFPFTAVDSLQSNVHVLVNEKAVPYQVQNSSLLVDGEVFNKPGGRFLTVTYDHVMFLKHILDVQEEIGNVTIAADKYHTVINDTIEFTFTFGRGDPIHVLIDYGDGFEEELYIQSAERPVRVTKTHSYTDLGLYHVKVEAANDVHYVSVYKVVTVERPLSYAEFYASNVTHPYDAVNFTVVADRGMPSIPLTCIFYYQDGEKEFVHGVTVTDDGEPFVHFRRYADFGIYNVKVVVSNNISSIDLYHLIQVGDNLTWVDLTTRTERVRVREDTADVQIYCPTGSAVTYTVDFGDGNIMVVLPHDIATTTPETYYTTTPQAPSLATDSFITSNDTLNAIELSKTPLDNVTLVEDDLLATRKRRAVNSTDWSESKNGTWQQAPFNHRMIALESLAAVEVGSGDMEGSGDVLVPTRPNKALPTTEGALSTQPNLYYDGFRVPEDGQIASPQDYSRSEDGRTVHVYHKYMKEGNFLVKVTASNKFGYVQNILCQDIVSRSEVLDLRQCARPRIKFRGLSTSLESPYQRMRSEKVIVDVAASIDCEGIKKATYSWKVFRIHQEIDPILERPTHEICTLLDKRTRFRMEPLTLPWGMYRLVATVSPLQHHVTYSKEDLYLEITKTPLVADIAGEPIRGVVYYDSLTIDMSASHDPDEEATEDPAFILDLFCYPMDVKEEFDKYDLEGLRNTSRHVTNSSNVHIHAFPTDDDGESECFKDPETKYVDFRGKKVRFAASNLGLNSSYVMHLFVSKDDRVSNMSQRFQVWNSNFTLEGMLNRLQELLASGDTGAVVMVLGTATKSMGNNSDDGVVGDLIGVVDEVAEKLQDTGQIIGATNALGALTGNSGGGKDDNKKKASSAVSKMAGKTRELTLSEPITKVEEVGAGMINVFSNIVPDNIDTEKMKEEARMRKRKRRAPHELGDIGSMHICKCLPPPKGEFEEEEVDIEAMTPKDGCPKLDADVRDLCQYFDDEEVIYMMQFEHIDDRKILLAERIEQFNAELQMKKDNDQEVTSNIGNAANGVTDVLLEKTEPDNPEPIVIESPKIALKLQKTNATEGGSQKMQAKGGGFNMPGDVLSQGSGGNASVGAKLMTSKNNPYSWGDTSSAIKTPVLSLSYMNEDGSPMEISNASEPIEIVLDKDASVIPKAVNFSLLSDGSLKCHHTKIPTNGSTIHVIVRPTLPEDRFRVYIKHMEFPNKTHYDHVDYIPREEDVDTEEDDVREELRYTYFPPANVTSLNGSYYICVELYGAKVTFPLIETNHSYSWQLYTSGCRFWNETTNDWGTDGCYVGELTHTKKTQCLCTHLTNFGGDFVVPPNSIDFSTVFSKFKDLHENAAVFSTVVTVLGLYFILLGWARYKDKKDKLKWEATPLEDNLPTDNYHYQITVTTGMRKKAGTTSKVSFILSGDDGDTGVRRLGDGKRKKFERGSILNFILSVEHSLGPLTFLRIWHDNCGHGKERSWFLEQVQLQDLQTGEKFFFLCDRWLAVEEDDGMVERILPVAGLEDLSDFKHLFSSSVKKKLTNEHLWFSVVSRPTKSNFTRVQRISCCLSLLFCTMIANAMFFKADDKKEKVNAIKLGPLSFTLSQLYVSLISTLIVFPVNLILVTVFRKARPKKNTISQMNAAIKSKKFRWRSMNPGSSLWNNVEKTKMQKFKESMSKILTFHQRSKYETEIPEEELPGYDKKKKKKGFTLPHWCMYFAWFLCFCSVSCSAFFVILYSLEWGKEKANEWLTTFVLSFFQSVVVVQPIKVFLLAAFISCVLKKPELDEEETFDEPPTTTTDEYLKKQQVNLQDLIMRRKMAQSSLKPPDLTALTAAREQRMKEIQMEAIIKEILIYFFFLLILFFLSYQTRSTSSYLFTEMIRNTFINTSPAIKDVHTIPQYWAWLNSVLLPGLYASSMYNGKRLDWRQSLAIDGFGANRVGVGRLRQMRVKDNTCRVQPLFRKIIHRCRDDYNWNDDDARDYYPLWKLPPQDNETALDILGDADTPWVYQSSLKLKNAPYMGVVNFYKGGGYVQDLGRTARASKRITQKLKDDDWFDQYTRAIFVEFTLFNPNVNLFASVVILKEFLAAGGSTTMPEIKIFRLFPYVGGFGIVVIIFELMFGAFTIYFLVREVGKIRKEGKAYFREFWNLMEFSTTCFSIAAIAMYIMKHGLAALAMNALEKSGSADFVNFQSLALWDETFGYMVGVVVFLATIKSLKLLRFNRRMGMLGDTIRIATQDLKVFSITFFLYFFAFCQAAYLLFGRHLPSYGTFIGSVEALFAFSLGSFSFDDMKDANPVLGPLFFFLFVAVVYIGLMGMFLTIINDSFATVKANAEMQSNDYEMVDFIVKRFKAAFGMETKEEPKEEDEEGDKEKN